MEDCAKNTDKEIWRRVPGDYYSPSIHVTEGGGIGLNCGGHVIVAPVEAWHECSEKLLCVNERIPSWRWRLAMWCLRTPNAAGEVRRDAVTSTGLLAVSESGDK